MAYTIDDLNALVQAASGDELPIWDVSASGPNDEPTKKITLQNLATAIKTLASLLGTGDVVNNLTSTATDKPLSANMGKTLEEHIQQSTANTHFYDISTATNTIKISASEAGAGIIMFRCSGTPDPQIIAIRDANGYKVISGTASVSTANDILTITAPGTYCFGRLISSHACTISYGT